MAKRTTRQRALRAYKENEMFSDSPLALAGAFLAEGTSIYDAIEIEYDAIEIELEKMDFHEQVIELLQLIAIEEEMKMNKVNKTK